MSITISKMRHIQKSPGGHLLTTPLESANYAQLGASIVQILNNSGYTSEPKVDGNKLVLPYILTHKDDSGNVIRVDRGRQILLAGNIANKLEKDMNIIAEIKVT